MAAAAAGIIVAVVAGLVALLLIIWLVLRSGKESEPPPPGNPPYQCREQVDPVWNTLRHFCVRESDQTPGPVGYDTKSECDANCASGYRFPWSLLDNLSRSAPRVCRAGLAWGTPPRTVPLAHADQLLFFLSLPPLLSRNKEVKRYVFVLKTLLFIGF